MKIIDIVNNVANNKKDVNPERIKVSGVDFIKCGSGDYINCKNEYLFDDIICFHEDNLNKEIETIEEDKKIEKLNIISGELTGKWENGSNYNYTLSQVHVLIIKKLNELIDEVNKLKGGKND